MLAEVRLDCMEMLHPQAHCGNVTTGTCNIYALRYDIRIVEND